MHPEFGIFEEVFDDWRGYLPLLNLASNDPHEAVELVRKCCHKMSDPFPDICRLLGDKNWRPHLVAAVAMIISGYQKNAVDLLWRQIDLGSWVTPQLGVALFLVDANFSVQAHIRLEAGCPIDTSDLVSMNPLERHSAAGSSESLDRSAKSAATLLYLLKIMPPEPDWLLEIRASEKMRDLLARDIDNSDGITESWLHRIKELTVESC